MLKRGLQIADAIVALMKNEISKEDLVLLDSWISESEENKKLFLQFMDEQTFMEKKQMFALKKKQPFYLVKAMKIVAAVVLIVGSFLFWKYREGKESAVQNVQFEEAPAVYLQLASGEKLSLYSKMHDTVIVSKTKEQIALGKEQLSIKEDVSNKVSNESCHKIVIPKGMKYQLTLSDGSRVWLNSEAQLKFPGKFMNKIRRVELSGEAYFEVEKDSLCPFVISTTEADIRVLGTTLNVQSYDGEPVVTTLVNGSVEVVVDSLCSTRLSPGQQAVTFKGKTSVQEVETYYYTAWKDGFFIFDDVPLKTIVETLCHWYDMQYRFIDISLEQIHITARLKKYAHIDSVLNVLSKTEGIRITNDHHTLLIESK